ncbi:hypothetical protein [Streptomyces sp. NPDC048643]|uniref:hypothetical protein n=1 Tax=Streptomyces sp. NPDC048643 TaxID=3155637 RepID=UPI00342D2CBA
MGADGEFGRRSLAFGGRAIWRGVGPAGVGNVGQPIEEFVQSGLAVVGGHVAAATVRLVAVRFKDVMIPYATWCGDWSDCWGGHTGNPSPPATTAPSGTAEQP